MYIVNPTAPITINIPNVSKNPGIIKLAIANATERAKIAPAAKIKPADVFLMVLLIPIFWKSQNTPPITTNTSAATIKPFMIAPANAFINIKPRPIVIIPSPKNANDFA